MANWLNFIRRDRKYTAPSINYQHGPVPKPPLHLMVTLWPSFPHFERFAHDYRLDGIRLNSAMIEACDLDKELELVKQAKDSVPLYFDIKGRQLRVRDVSTIGPNLELKLNHPISAQTPTMVLFKAGADYALLKEIKDGTHLIFEGGPQYMVKVGESLHIRHPSLKVGGPIFCDYEIEKIKKVVKAGFNKYFLSYVEDQRDIDEFREFIGDRLLVAKIESKKGLEFVANKFSKRGNLCLMAARGDLYVEVDMPHQILEAMRLIVEKDSNAYVGSRILLSMVNNPVPEMADLSDMAWIYDLGYRNMMLCDELCLKEPLLARAVNAMSAFKQSYAK